MLKKLLLLIQLYVGKSITVKEAANFDGTFNVSGATTLDNTLCSRNC